MKTIKEQADELVSKLSNHTDWENYQDIECAMIAVEHTIEILNMCNAHSLVDFTLEQQTELLNELKSRL